MRYLFLVSFVSLTVLSSPSFAMDLEDEPQNDIKIPARSKVITVTPIDFDKDPIPGQDAFWAHNPNNPSQKILLVPSRHSINLRFIQADLQKAMKEGDILVTESITSLESWHDGGKFHSALRTPIAELKARGIIKNNPFYIKGISWIEYVKHLAPLSFDYLQGEIQPFLEGIPLENIHPDFLNYVLSIVAADKEKKRFLGIDRQIVRYYSLQNKPVLQLETLKDLQDLGIMEDPIPIATQLAAIPLDVESTAKTFITMENTIQDILNLTEETPNKAHANTLKDIERLNSLEKISTNDKTTDKVYQGTALRNALWDRKLPAMFDENPDKSFVIVVGGYHFPWNTGILKRLSYRNYTFTPFAAGSTTTTTAIRPFKGIEPRTKEQKQIAAAEMKKEIIQKEQENAIIQVIWAFGKGLPQIIETGKPLKGALAIKAELINVMVRLLKADPTWNIAANAVFLKIYIETRNTIYTDTTITDKKKAREILESNPFFNISEVKNSLH